MRKKEKGKENKTEIKTHKRGKFPFFGVILLLIGVIWLLQELEYLTADVPWVPLLLIVVAMGVIVNRYSRKS